ncbi:hypothetical protein ACFL1C_08255 [Pseudomonadota bacterium]
MKQFLRLFFTISACLVAASAVAKGPVDRGPVDKATGEHTYGSCQDCVPGDELNFVSHRLMSAHEASGKHPQKGFIFSWNDDGRWLEMDLRDTHNTCVHVFADGRVRTGGLVSEGNGPQVGRYFGLDFVDGGEPAYFLDHGATIRFGLDYDSEAARLAFLDWCETGDLPDPPTYGLAVWGFVISQGNVQVHNYPGDGD